MKIETCEISAAEIIHALETEETLVLATCADNRVTIRPMSHINDGLAVYFQTGKDSLKMRQIHENSKVALCVGTYEIEGTAVEIGHPLSGENRFFAEKYKAKHPQSFEAYSALEDEIIIKVNVRHARQWRYIGGKPFLAEIRFD